MIAIVTWRAVGLWCGVGAAALAACGGSRTVALPDVAAVTAPTVSPRPSDLADAAQLAALVPRDVAGLPPSSASADAALLPAAMAALRAQVPEAHDLERLSIYDSGVFFTYADPTTPGRATSAVFDPDLGLRVFEPQLRSDDTFAMDAVDPNVPGALVAGIERRYPTVHVTSVDLRRGLSFGFDLAWFLGLEDAAGRLANVFADLDGTVIAVDDET